MDEKTKKGIDKTVEIRYNNGRARRGVAQFGRVLGLGPRCRRFKSCRLDQKNLVKLLTMDQKPAIINRLSPQYAGVAQLVEQLICNQQVAGSSPFAGSIFDRRASVGFLFLRLFCNFCGFYLYGSIYLLYLNCKFY